MHNDQLLNLWSDGCIHDCQAKVRMHVTIAIKSFTFDRKSISKTLQVRERNVKAVCANTTHTER
jgi:hypothetical protein